MAIPLPFGLGYIGTAEDVRSLSLRQELARKQQDEADVASVAMRLSTMGGDDDRIINELPKTLRPPGDAAAKMIQDAVQGAQARLRQRGANIFGPVQVPGSTAPGPMVPGPMVAGPDQEIPYSPDRQERAGGAGPMVGPTTPPPPNVVAARGMPAFPTAAPGGPAGTVAASVKGPAVAGPMVKGPDVVTPATTREAEPEEIAQRVLDQASSGAGSAEILKPFQPLVGDVIRARIAEQGLNQRERLAQLANQWDLKEVQGVPVLMNKRTGELRYPSGQDQEASLIYLQKAAEAKASGEARGKAAVPSFQPATENQPAGYPEPLTRGFTALPGQTAAPMKWDLNKARAITTAPAGTHPPELVKQAQDFIAGYEGSEIKIAGARRAATEEAERESKAKEPIGRAEGQLYRHGQTLAPVPGRTPRGEIMNNPEYVEVSKDQAEALDSLDAVRGGLASMDKTFRKIFKQGESPIEAGLRIKSERLTGTPEVRSTLRELDALKVTLTPQIRKVMLGDTGNMAQQEQAIVMNALASDWNDLDSALAGLNVFRRYAENVPNRIRERARQQMGPAPTAPTTAPAAAPAGAPGAPPQRDSRIKRLSP